MNRGTLYAGILALSFFSVPQPGLSQEGPHLSHRAAAIKKEVDALAPQTTITIVTQVHGKRKSGGFVSSNAEGFTFYDFAEKRNVTLRYEEVEKITDGATNSQSSGKQHSRVLKHVIFWVILAGGLLAISLAAAAS